MELEVLTKRIGVSNQEKVFLIYEMGEKFKAKNDIPDYKCFSNLDEFDELMHGLYDQLQ